MTDATPLVETRAAIQRLKKENKELDLHIGILVSIFLVQHVQMMSVYPYVTESVFNFHSLSNVLQMKGL